MPSFLLRDAFADEPRRQHNVRVGPRKNVEPVADQIPQEPARQAAHRRRREGPEPPVLQAELLPQIAKVVQHALGKRGVRNIIVVLQVDKLIVAASGAQVSNA